MGLSKQQQARLKAFGDGISYSEGTKGFDRAKKEFQSLNGAAAKSK